MSIYRIGRYDIDLEHVTDAAMGEAGLELHFTNPADDSASVLVVGQPEDIDRVLDLLAEHRSDIHVRTL